MRILWTEEEETILRKLVGKHVLPETISQAMGRTENAIRSKISSLGLETPTPVASVDYDLIKRLLEPEEI
jgi:hypothetical protein